MVVRGGAVEVAVGVSSKPTTDRSRGTWIPRAVAASTTPHASPSPLAPPGGGRPPHTGRQLVTHGHDARGPIGALEQVARDLACRLARRLVVGDREGRHGVPGKAGVLDGP